MENIMQQVKMCEIEAQLREVALKQHIMNTCLYIPMNTFHYAAKKTFHEYSAAANSRVNGIRENYKALQ